MFPDRIYNLNIASVKELATPAEMKNRYPLTPDAEETVYQNRIALQNILDRRDPRLLLIAGPCSIHDAASALEYAARLKGLSEKTKDTFVILMRAYFEKPRTTIGWKGYINDPRLDGTYRIEEGLEKARDLLLKIAELGMGTATEALDPIVPQYLHDLISWTSIGARTTESQRHREMASGLSTPVGIKNGTDGNIQVGINALLAIHQPHHFLGIDRNGQCAIMETKGNRYCHLVLRGGDKANYDPVSVARCETALQNTRLPVNLVIDCSHGNSCKDPKNQPLVLNSCVDQILDGNRSIIGAMLESHLHEGNQPFPKNLKDLVYGVSITDGCIDWETTERIVLEARDRVKGALSQRDTEESLVTA
jgi:3-deoxy-7-phosphoheptulonate synthase